MYVYVHIFVHVFICVYMYVCTGIYVYIHTVHIYIYSHAYICSYIYLDAYAHINTWNVDLLAMYQKKMCVCIRDKFCAETKKQHYFSSKVARAFKASLAVPAVAVT